MIDQHVLQEATNRVNVPSCPAHSPTLPWAFTEKVC